MNNALSKMFLIDPETYKQLQQNVIQAKNLTYLDKMMNKILHNSKLSVNKKWYLYRQQLIKYALLRRNSNSHPNNIKPKIVAPTKQIETQTTPTVEYSDNDDLGDFEEDGHTGSLSISLSPPKPRLIRSAEPSINLSEYGIADEMDDEKNIEEELFSTPKWSTSTPKPDLYRLAFLNQQAENDKYYDEITKERDEAVNQVYEIKEPSPEKKKNENIPKPVKRKIINSPFSNLRAKEKSPIAPKKLKENTSHVVGVPSTSAGLYKVSRPRAVPSTQRVTRAVTRKQQQQQKGGRIIKWQRL